MVSPVLATEAAAHVKSNTNFMNSQAPSPSEAVVVTLADGKPRTLRYSIKTMKKLREKMHSAGFPTGAAFHAYITREDDKNVIDIEKFADLLHRGLTHKFDGGDPDLTLDDVEELIDAKSSSETLRLLMSAIGLAMPEKNAMQPAPVAPPAPPEPVDKSQVM